MTQRRIILIAAVALAVLAALIVLTVAAWSGGAEEPSTATAIELRAWDHDSVGRTSTRQRDDRI